MQTMAAPVEQQQSPAVAALPLEKKTRVRTRDQGPDLLAHMEHFVKLVRRVRRPALLQALLNHAGGSTQVDRAVVDTAVAAAGTLPIAARNTVFAAVAQLPITVQARLERAAERIVLLCDESGAVAMSEVLDVPHPDATDGGAGTPVPDDKFTRALWLYLHQESPVQPGAEVAPGTRDRCFEHAETRQEMLRQAQAGKYSSHYLGPQGVQPLLDDDTQAALRAGLAALFPQIDPEDIVIEAFVRRDAAQPGEPVGLYTLSALFNGRRVHYQQLDDGEVLECDEPAVTSVRFAWQPGQGALGVFCDVKARRPELAALFRDVVLGGNGDIRAMPMREFELIGFSTSAMLACLKTDRIDGIEHIAIQHIVVSRPHTREVQVRGRPMTRVVQNDLRIRRHRDEERSLYEVAHEDYKLADFVGYDILEVKLALRIARQAQRRAHTVTVEVRAPNGLSDRCKTDADRELVFAQLVNLGCAWQY